ncbi:MAG: 4Fe-4S dicluster domain-containing protein [Deltaproteobacteria bacterium]|nr:4Fe-4S dicluster domain-containing protein [Deltaproteobacteria bacterium]
MSQKKVEEKKKERLWGMVIDTRKCIGCHTCTVACKSENNVPLGYWRSWVKGVQKGTYPEVRNYYLRRLCNQCDTPPCVEVCPVKATEKRDDGIVVIHYGKCIGCGMCITACPYDARFFNPIRKTADKCDFCLARIDRGLEPACVSSCVGRAITFGDMKDPDSEISKLLATTSTSVLKPELGTKPKVHYIMPEETLMGRIKISDDFKESVLDYEKSIVGKPAEYWKKEKAKGKT